MEVNWILVAAATIGGLACLVFGYVLCRIVTGKRADGVFVIDKADEEGRAGMYLEGFFPDYESLMKRKIVIFRVENRLKDSLSKNSQP